MTEKKYRQELEKAKKESQSRKYKSEILAERNKYKTKKHIETSKLIAVYLFALLNAIVIYAMVSMWRFSDLSYLGVLITDIAAQILIYGIYCLKSYKGKKSEEDLKFEREKLSFGELFDVRGKKEDVTSVEDESADATDNNTDYTDNPVG